MIISKSMLLHLLAASSTAAVADRKMPPLHPKFHGHLKCPYANQWLIKGPEQAAIDFGLGWNRISHNKGSGRSLEETVMGRCAYTNPFSGDSCMEFRGEGWATQDMSERCGRETDGSFVGREGCDSENAAGYCVKSVADDTYEYTVLTLSAESDCAGNKMACETFIGGSFAAAAACDVADDTVMGSCSYTNPFSGDSCMEFRGSAWTSESMEERCAQESSSSLQNEGCVSSENTAGYCVKSIADDTFEYNVLELSENTDCDGTKMACETFVGGQFTAAGACGSTNAAESSSSASSAFDISSGSSEPAACGIAPGAIGAAHQNAFSTGYSESGCPDTPAQGSPYMWPLKWAADYETQNMAFGSDDVVFKSMGRTFYRLDKNWKRSDTTYQVGELRTIGQGPCDDVDEQWEEQGLNACSKNQTDFVTTMLHMGNMMYFVSWKDDADVEPGETDATKIQDCSSINLQVIGNIRPDWFLDARGDDTDVQYLGNQHVFYNEVPKLVKQWRKKDFASQYFTMSMLENNPSKMADNETDVKTEDTIKWPLILNIPGEGFGDDMLQRYSNHALLTDNDDDLFLLIENFLESGGVCEDVGTGEGAGPPILDVHIPSNLEIDPNAWFSNVFTFSPFYTPATSDDVESVSMGSSNTPNKAVTEVNDRVTVESCWDENTNSVDMTVHYFDVELTSAGTLPWIALGLRSSEVCAMTPPSGGNTPMILITHLSAESAPDANSAELFPGAKGMSDEAFGAIYQSLTPLDESVGYSSVSLSAPMVSLAASERSISSDDTVSLSFKQDADTKPDIMYFTYAIGAESQLGVHITRACFELVDFPSCSESSSTSSTSDGGVSVGIEDLLTDNTQKVSAEPSSGAHAMSVIAAVLLSFTMAHISY